MKFLKTITLFVTLALVCGNVFAQTPIKRVLVEESTGTWCASCGFGSVYFEHLESKYPNTIPVAVHTGPGGQDPMAIFSVELYMIPYFSGSPTFLFDRKDFPSNPNSKPAISASNPSWEFGLDTLDKYMDMIYNQSPLATVGLTQSYNAITRELTVTVNSNFIQNATGEFRLNCFILEDSVTGGSEYNQANSNFSGWTSGPAYLADLISAPNPIVGYNHNHVLRATLGNPEGATASIPTTVTAGSSYSKTFTYTIPAGFDESQISLVGLVQRYGADVVQDREIVNAYSEHLNLSPLSISKLPQDFITISVYPNPLAANSTMEFYVKNNDNISCDLINSNGQIVKHIFNKHFTQGEYKMNLGVDTLPNGIYFLKFTNSETSTIKKIVVNN